MLENLSKWKGAVEINGTFYNSIEDASKRVKKDESYHIILSPSSPTGKKRKFESEDSQEFRITVKSYMTKRASIDFDFMEKWNNNVPMPLKVMIGTKEKETRGMVYMKLHGDIYARTIPVCMKCGKPLTNSVSQYFGVGPECGGHNYVNPFKTEKELMRAVAAYRKRLQAITWEGWIVKSAIIEEIPL